MFYYKCRRCEHITKQKNDMKKHLNKVKKCILINNEGKSDEELYEESLNRYEIDNGLNINIEVKDKKFVCDKCNSAFKNQSNLNRHLKNTIFCKNVSEKYQDVSYKNIDIQNIDIQNNIVNNTFINNNTININVNSLKGFEEEWDISNITQEMRKNLLLSNTKFTNTLKNILENDENLNVILKDKSTGIVYKIKNKEYEAMHVNDILELSMDKIYKHLKDFFQEIITNNNSIDKSIIKDIDAKYNNYKKNTDTKNNVNNYLTDIFDENKNKSIQKFIETIQNNESCDTNINSIEYSSSNTAY